MKLPGRSAARTALWSLFLGGVCVFLYSKPSPQVQVHSSVEPGRAVETPPQASLTLMFRVTNASIEKAEFEDPIELPQGWRRITSGGVFGLDPGEQTFRLVGVFVPLQAAAGEYPLTYSVVPKGSASPAQSVGLRVKVLAASALVVQALDAPPMVVAGESYAAKFRVTNRGNASQAVVFETKSGEGFPAQPEVSGMKLGPGESLALAVTVQTDARLRKLVAHRLGFTAVAPDADPAVRASASTEVKVIPRVSGVDDYYRRLPMEFSVMGLYGPARGIQTQFRLSGVGALDAKGRQNVDFSFRGPGRRDLLSFGMQEEEYRLVVDLPSADFLIGDGIYALTKLTQAGRYGRGASGDVGLGPFSFKAYLFDNLRDFSDYRQKEKAVRLGLSPLSSLIFGLNYVSSWTSGGSGQETISLESRFNSKPLTFVAEYAVGRQTGQRDQGPDRAIWFDARGQLGPAGYQTTFIRAGTNFPGSYRNLDYTSGLAFLRILKAINLKAAYTEQAIRASSDLYISSIFVRTVQAGLQAQPVKALIFSFDGRTEERKDLSQAADFYYRDETVRAGLVAFAPSLQVQASVDWGRTRNFMTGQIAALREYSAALDFRPSADISFGADVRYREQDRDFTGEKLQSLDVRLDASLKVGRLDVQAYYRTSFRREFAPGVYEQLTLNDPYLMAHRIDTIESSLSYRFKNGHSLALRFRASSPLDSFTAGGGAIRHIMASLEYTVPIRMPVSRKADVSKIRGRVIDEERANAGLANVLVKANDLAVLTNASGEYCFHGVKPDTYYLSLDEKTIPSNRISLQPLPLDVAVDGRRDTVVDVGLARPGLVSGRIAVYRFDGDPTGQGLVSPSPLKAAEALKESGGLANAMVELKSEKETLMQVTDEAGRFEFEDVRPGAWTLLAFGDELPEFSYLEKESTEVDLKPGDRREILFRVLPRQRQIRFRDSGELVGGGGGNVLKPQPTKPAAATPGSAARRSAALPGTSRIIQVGVYSTRDGAQRFIREIAELCPAAYVARHDIKGRTFYRVLVPCANVDEAVVLAEKLGRKGIEVFTAKDIGGKK